MTPACDFLKLHLEELKIQYSVRPEMEYHLKYLEGKITLTEQLLKNNRVYSVDLSRLKYFLMERQNRILRQQVENYNLKACVLQGKIALIEDVQNFMDGW
jgi:post-segregation antitoxin (ccd killing protein)